MKQLYLLLAIIGAVIPYLFFAQFMLNEGINIPVFIAALFANPAASGFTADLLITSFVFWLMMFYEQRQGKTITINPIILILLNLLIGLSCALPAYLYLRERQKDL